jgi:hypothetical protein
MPSAAQRIATSQPRQREYVEGILHKDAVYTTAGAMVATGLGEDALRELRHSGKLKGYRMNGGGPIRYRGEDLIEAILQESEVV